MLKLQYKDGQRSAWLVGPRMRIGRSKGNELVLDDKQVADFHAELHIDPGKLSIHVVGKNKVSVNGVEVNGNKVLSLGDEITLANREFTIVDPKREPPIKGVEENSTASAVKIKKVNSSGTGSGWVLQGSHKSLRNKRYPINGVVVLGRSNDCEFNFAYDRLSRRHAEIKENNGILYVKDLNSSNGTFVNGKRVEESRVRPGDVLSFDKLSFSVMGPGSLDDADLSGGDELNKTVINPAIDVATINRAAREAKAANTRSRKRLAEEAVEAMSSPDAEEKKSQMNHAVMVVVAVVLLAGATALWIL